MKNRKSVKIIFIFVIAVMAVIYLYWVNTKIGVTNITVTSENIPDEFNGFKIVHISDLHNAEFGDGQKDLIGKIEAQDADIVVITGDMIDSRRTDVDKAVELITGLGNKIPVYYVTGNHESRVREYNELESKLIENGVTVLKNESIKIEKDGSFINIIGVDDPSFGMSAKDIFDTVSELKTDGYDVLLSHRPELFETYCESGAELVLCGHAHGGQVRIPFAGGLVAPNQGLFPEYTAGSYKSGSTEMIVSRGLGNSIIPLRVNNPPELVVITLSGEV